MPRKKFCRNEGKAESRQMIKCHEMTNCRETRMASSVTTKYLQSQIRNSLDKEFSRFIVSAKTRPPPEKTSHHGASTIDKGN